MLELHLEIDGKAARVSGATLPEARGKAEWKRRTSAGEITRQRILSGTPPALDVSTLTADELIAGDPEIDFASAGRSLDAELTAAWFDPSAPVPVPVGDFRQIDIDTDATGAEKERRPHLVRTQNLNTLTPLKVGKRLPAEQVLTGFLFRQTVQLMHTDSLTKDFLCNLAASLHGKNEMALLGAGPKGNQPLVIREGGTPYRAFLYGETGSGAEADHYRLLVMLTDQELKRPAAPAPADA